MGMPEVLQLAGHPVRWQLLAELAHSDRQVRELTDLVGQQQSLTSYHLRRLRTGGLVTMRHSSADRRDTYYSLDLVACRAAFAEAGAALHPGLRPGTSSSVPPAPPRPVRVLFLCTGNSSRSQMAEAILQQVGGASVEVASAGSHPKALHPDAVRAMRARGIDIAGRRAKPIDDVADRGFDRVISLCDKVREVCPEIPEARLTHWSIPDPAAAEDGYAAFVRTADELSRRIEFLLYVLSTREGRRSR
jgi:ArsR family transcriptional regulator, arsenate/arsenite/antimonite-responsive transcriptional repressor / arsenate reductase (thioredoxin)